MAPVLVCEVGPRDGLQNEDRVLSVAARVEFVNRLSDCGFPRIEAGSFVSARRVPQMADAEQVFDQIVRRPGVEYSGLVLNLKGAQRALACGVDRLNCVVVATETFNMRNQGKAVADTVAELDAVIALAAQTSVPVTVTIAAAFGCPFEGLVAPSAVAALAAHFAQPESAEIALADTIGVGVPTQVQDLFARGVRSDQRHSAYRSDSTSTTPETPVLPMPLRRCRPERVCSTRLLAVPAAARSHRRRPETSPLKTWCTCSTAWEGRPGSTSTALWGRHIGSPGNWGASCPVWSAAPAPTGAPRPDAVQQVSG